MYVFNIISPPLAVPGKPKSPIATALELINISSPVPPLNADVPSPSVLVAIVIARDAGIIVAEAFVAFMNNGVEELEFIIFTAFVTDAAYDADAAVVIEPSMVP